MYYYVLLDIVETVPTRNKMFFQLNKIIGLVFLFAQNDKAIRTWVTFQHKFCTTLLYRSVVIL